MRRLCQADVTGLPSSAYWPPKAAVLNFEEEREKAFLVLWSSGIGKKNFLFCLLCQPQALMARAPSGEQAEGQSASGQREVMPKVCRNLRERELELNVSALCTKFEST